MMKEDTGLRSKGFTLIELLVALVLSFILIGAIFGTFTSQQKAYTVQDQIAEAQQNARMAMNILLRDIRMAGYGIPDGGIIIGKATYSHAIEIEKADNQQSFDSITLVGAFGAPSGHLDRTLSSGSSELFLWPHDKDFSKEFDSAAKKYIFIGGIDRLEVASVSGNRVVLNNGKTAVRYPTAILSKRADAGANQIYVYNASGLGTGDSLSLGNETLFVTAVDDQSAEHSITVDTDLEITGNQGIGRAYPAGTKINPIPVFRVTAVHYTIDPYTGSLLREDKAEVAGGGAAAELAGNIQDITITPEDPSADLNDQRSYTVTLTAQTKNPDPEYWQNGGYRLRALSSVVALRNP
jgi:prepilin-type N-terminal cleavage/methylation domain-containing protein